jgi:hypothetical protein
MILPLIYIVYLAITQYITGGQLNTTINVIMSVSYFIFSLMLLINLAYDKILNISKSLIMVSLPLLIYEAYYRITHPIFFTANGFDYREDENLFFYPYKFNSIMFADSNFVGVMLVVLFFFAYYLEKYHNQNFKLEKSIIFLLIIATISRAAIIATVLFYFIFMFWDYKYKIIKYIFTSLSVIGFFFMLIYLANDESFQTKFKIIDLTIQFIETSSIQQLLLGVGYGNTKDIFGIGAHNFIVTHIVESGLIGFVMLLSIWLSIYFQTKKNLIIMLPFLLTGMSLAGHAIPYLYVMFAIVIQFEKLRLKEKIC